MGEPARKLAFQKSTGSWVIVQPAGDGYEVAETLDAEPEHWTGEAYDLASAHPKASAELRSQLDWYRGNMIDEPSGPLDENGKTTGVAYEPQTAAPQAPTAVTTPVESEESIWERFLASTKPPARDPAQIGSRGPFPAGSVPSDYRVTGRSFGSPLVSDAENAARIAGQGFTLRAGDELSAYGASNDSTLFEQPGTPNSMRTARGFQTQPMTDEERRAAVYEEVLRNSREDDERARAESPVATTLAEGAAATPMAIATAPLTGARAGMGVHALAARNAAQGAVMGGVAGGAGATGEPGDSRVRGAAVGAGTGAAAGAAGTYAGEGVTRGGRALSDVVDDTLNALRSSKAGQGIAGFARDKAASFRNDALGGFGGRAQAVADKEGVDFLERDFAESAERLSPPQPGPLGIPKPRTATDYAKEFGPIRERIGQQYGQAIDDMAGPQGVTAPLKGSGIRDASGQVDDVGALDALDSQIARLGKSTGRADKTRAAELRRIREAIVKRVGDGERADMRTLQDIKSEQAASGESAASLKGTPAGVRAQAARDAERSVIGSMRSAAQSQATPETAALYRDSARDYPIAKMAEDLGNRARVKDSAGPSGWSAFQWGKEAVRDNYGADVAANAFRGVERAMTPVMGPRPPPPSTMPRAGQPAIAASIAAQGAVPDDIFAGSPDFAIEEPAEPLQQTQQALGKHPMAHAIDVALRANHGESLGRWAPELQQAIESGDRNEFGALMLRLSKDKDFQREVMPTLASFNKRNGVAQP